MRHKSSETTLNKKVLLIGNLAQEGITTKITALGHIYQQRHLLTTPLNWMTIEKNINQLRTSGELFAVFVNLIESAIFHSCSPEYQEVWQLLLIELKQTASLIFVCEDNLLGKFSSVESVSLNRQLTQAQIKKDEALKTIADAQKSRDEAEQAIVNAQKSRDEAEQAIVNAQKSKSKADRAIAEAQKRKSKADRAIAEAQKRKVKADRAIADTQKRIATAVEQAIAEKRIATAVEQAIAEAQKSKNEAEQAIANAQKSRDEAEQAIADTQKRIATAVEQDEAEKSRDEAEQAIVNAQKSRDEADRTITDAQKRKVKADRAIAEAQKSKARPEQTFAEAHRRKTTAEQAIVNAQKSRDEADRTIAEVQKERVKRLPERVPRAEQLLKDIQRSGVEVVPYKRKEEITFRIQQFLDEVDNGVFLHLYVPNGRYQADQLANFLRLFENYLQHIEKLQFSIDLRRTQHGLVYLFKSKDTFSSLTDMGEAITRFEGFMSLCQNDPKKAETILLNTGVHPAEASRLVTKYTRDYQRLELDMRHELEQKTLALGQRLESEVFELSYGEIHSLLPSEHISTLLSIPFNSGSVSINISSLSNSNNSVVQSLYEQTVNGDINYTNEDKQLIEMFERHAARLEAICLKSELEQLKDNSSPEEVRKTAKQKIIGFLYKVAPAIGQSALQVLTAYLQKVLTGA